ncbi:MAG: hypothetical protein NZ483_03480 [Verrucomicrobiae bacterium]|nr:hypothetical protein [Verrucomicrobiae bacterium]MDW8345069.1 hypothetical protein [Verrucomicrobiae bacterium]
MYRFALMLLGFFVVAKTFARFYLFRATPERPSFCRSNEALLVIDFFAWLALAGAVVLLLNYRSPVKVGVLALVFVGYDQLIRFVFMRREIKRLMRRSSSRWKYRDARRHVLRRAETVMFH